MTKTYPLIYNISPTLASLIMSLESVFAVLFGWLLLRQSLSGREILGCILVFAAIVLSELPLENLPLVKKAKKFKIRVDKDIPSDI